MTALHLCRSIGTNVKMQAKVTWGRDKWLKQLPRLSGASGCARESALRPEKDSRLCAWWEDSGDGGGIADHGVLLGPLPGFLETSV